MAIHHTRAVVVALDPSPYQEQLLRSHCGSSRTAYNWAIELVKDNLDTRATERMNGVATESMTPAISWSPYSLTPLWVRHQTSWLRSITRWSTTRFGQGLPTPRLL